MMRAEEECGEKRQRGVEKKIEETKIKLWAQSKKAQRQYYKNKIERQAYHGGNFIGHH